MIVGSDRRGHGVRDYLLSLRYTGYRFVGFVTLDETEGGKSAIDPNVLGNLSTILPVARSLFVDELFFTSKPERHILAKTLDAAKEAAVDVRLVPDLSEALNRANQFEYIVDLPTVMLHREKGRKGSRLIKRVIDVVGASSTLVLSLPVMILVAIAVRLSSKGPLFYVSDRVGRKGRSFRCYKFRTMVWNAEALRAELSHLNEREGILFKIARDPRITSIGRILRRYSLDELPQLWNVVRGEMSLVGPRPPLCAEVAQYKLDQFRRLEVPPGITGLWQVEARANPSFDSYIELDRRYVIDWSNRLDLCIMLRTITVLLKGTGS